MDECSMNGLCSTCTKFWQAPVDELHSIEDKRFIVAIISLTSSAAGVETHSFFDKFSSSSGGKLPLQDARKRVQKTSATPWRKLNH
jgi:hypothetical protein